jgi:hypothetical protein
MTSKADETLEQITRDVLISSLDQKLKDSIDDALRKGASRAAILDFLRHETGGPNSLRGGLVYLACHAYLEGK